jgi:hypothetical protein
MRRRDAGIVRVRASHLRRLFCGEKGVCVHMEAYDPLFHSAIHSNSSSLWGACLYKHHVHAGLYTYRYMHVAESLDIRAEQLP